jgi:beta-carotene hydroxylase
LQSLLATALPGITRRTYNGELTSSTLLFEVVSLWDFLSKWVTFYYRMIPMLNSEVSKDPAVPAKSQPQIHRYMTRTTAWPTVIMSAIFVFGAPANFFVVANGLIPWWVGLLIGIALYNSAFTIWHEAAHGNIVPSNRKLNDTIGVIASFVNMLPAFFRQRHDHLMHHSHLLETERDRTVPRATGPIWGIALSILDEMRTYGPYKDKYGLKDLKKLKVDRWTYLAVFIALAASIVSGTFWAFLACCFIPRLIILPIHVTYVCYLPHVGLPSDSWRGTRTLNIGPLKYLIFFHNYHAVHHIWPSIPWFRYERYFTLNKSAMIARGVELEVRPWNAPILGEASLKTGYDIAGSK